MSDLFLLSLYGGGADAGSASLLATLYGQGGVRRPASVSPFIAMRSAEQNRERDIGLTAAQPEIKRAIAGFRAGVAKATSVDALLRDPRVLEVLLTANGLGDQTSRPALARKALTADLADPASLINRLTDSRWKPAAETYDFANRGLAVIQDQRVIDKLADAYAEVKWRKSLDEATPGLSKALTFRAQAASVTSALQILGDPVLRDVVTTALGIPKQIAFQPLTAQENAITTRLDIAKLADPKFVEAFAQRYLLAAAQNAQTNPATDLTALAVRSAGLVI
jgi:hypothetical protein